MPRKPTGRPRGRPVGTGKLGEQTRLTVRIPLELYTRLEAFAETRRYTRGTPQLAECVREALEQYLAQPHNRQTKNLTIVHEHNNGQTENDTGQPTEAIPFPRVEQEEFLSDRNASALDEVLDGATRAELEALFADTTHPALDTVLAEVEAEVREDKRQTENSKGAAPVPAYDTNKYVLGKLCPRGHDYHRTGKTLLRLPKYVCPQCDAERARERRANRQKR